MVKAKPLTNKTDDREKVTVYLENDQIAALRKGESISPIAAQIRKAVAIFIRLETSIGIIGGLRYVEEADDKQVAGLVRQALKDYDKFLEHQKFLENEERAEKRRRENKNK